VCERETDKERERERKREKGEMRIDCYCEQPGSPASTFVDGEDLDENVRAQKAKLRCESSSERRKGE
jgi:hypothetical protein